MKKPLPGGPDFMSSTIGAMTTAYTQPTAQPANAVKAAPQPTTHRWHHQVTLDLATGQVYRTITPVPIPSR
jgi:hypothetical protein